MNAVVRVDQSSLSPGKIALFVLSLLKGSFVRLNILVDLQLDGGQVKSNCRNYGRVLRLPVERPRALTEDMGLINRTIDIEPEIFQCGPLGLSQCLCSCVRRIAGIQSPLQITSRHFRDGKLVVVAASPGTKRAHGGRFEGLMFTEMSCLVRPHR